MSYAVVANIQSEFKNIIFDANSAITDTEVGTFISEEEAIINASISNRYVVPVIDDESILVLKRISIAYVAYRVAKTLNLKKDVPIPEKFVPQDLSEGALFRVAKKLLADIKTGTIVLQDATAISQGQGVESFNASNNVESVWKRDTKQW